MSDSEIEGPVPFWAPKLRALLERRYLPFVIYLNILTRSAHKGTDNFGDVCPGASVPFGMVREYPPPMAIWSWNNLHSRSNSQAT